jgi:DNA transformation protein and related proteins
MAVSPSYRDYVTDQLEQACELPIRIKSMFGGAGVYAGELFFAIIADETLYFKVDESNRPDFEAAGMEPFTPFPDKDFIMGYYQLPEEVLDDVGELEQWVTKALEVAERTGKRRKPKKKNK